MMVTKQEMLSMGYINDKDSSCHHCCLDLWSICGVIRGVSFECSGLVWADPNKIGSDALKAFVAMKISHT